MSLHCVIVEDQTMFRQMLHNMMDGVPELQVMATAEDQAGGLAAVEKHRPDLLLLDLNLPDGHGLEIARRLVALHPEARIIILSGEASTFICPAGLRGQVHAVLDKTQAFDELADALKTLLPKARGGSSSTRGQGVRARLSEREYEIFLLVGRGLLSKEIGEKLHISPQTVQVHRRKMAEKLGTTGSEFVQLAIKHYQSTLGSRS
jgi:DNA-binding NarL/FixJ family response regulator